MCRWCERSPIADQLTAGLLLPVRREFSADPDAARGGGPVPRPPQPSSSATARSAPWWSAGIGSMRWRLRARPFSPPVQRRRSRPRAGSKASVVDLQGRTLLPGLIDPHHHYTLSALLAQALLNIGYSGFHTKAQALQRLTATAATTPAGQWIAAGFFDNLLQGGDLSMPRSMGPRCHRSGLRPGPADRRQPHRARHHGASRSDRPDEGTGRGAQLHPGLHLPLRRCLPRPDLRRRTCGVHEPVPVRPPTPASAFPCTPTPPQPGCRSIHCATCRLPLPAAARSTDRLSAPCWH